MAIELTNEERGRLASLVIGIMDEWKLEPEQQLLLLGQEPDRPREINRYRRGHPFPQDDTFIEHARHIIGIQQSLRVVFPLNPHMPTFWLRNGNNRQFRQAPLEVMLQEGLNGMRRIWGHLDCTQNWD